MRTPLIPSLRTRSIVLAGVLLIALITIGAATQVTLSNMKGPTSTTGLVAVFQPNGQFAAYRLTPPLNFDNTNGLLKVASTSVAMTDISFTLTAANQTQPLPAPSCKLVYAYWNGLMMSPSIDYTVTNGVPPANGTILFNDANPLAVGDTMRITCFQ